MSSTLRYFRVRIPNIRASTHTLCYMFVCSVVELVFFISFIFITNIFMDCIWWTAVNPFGHWAQEPKRGWHGIKIERLPCFNHYIRTYVHTSILNVLCACTVKFYTFPFGQSTASLMLQFHSYYFALSFCLMEFFAFPFLLDGMSVIRPFTIQYTPVLFRSTFKKMRLYLIFSLPHSSLSVHSIFSPSFNPFRFAHTGSYPSTKFIAEILLHDRTIST